jgi:RND family efflux transporter MFP subunit
MSQYAQTAGTRSAGFHAFALCALALATLPLGTALAQPPADAAAMSSDASLTVSTGQVQRIDFTRYLSVNGVVNAWQEVVIAPEVGGYRVEEVLVDVGDDVQAGQELVRLSTALLQTDVSVRAAALKQREAELVNANLAFERGKTIAAQNLLAASDLDRLESEAIGAAGRVEAAEADMEAANVRLRFARVTAPDDGVISARNVSVGQIAQAGTELLRLLRQNRIEWRGEVPESDLPSLRVGQSVSIISVDGREHLGTIRIVSPTVNSSTHTGLVYVDVASDDALRPGMFARGQIEVSKGDALVVPLNAMVSSDGYHYVYVVDANRTVRRREIETGVIQGDNIEVLEGLEPGATIVTSGAGFLKDGDLVNVVGGN